MAEGKKCRWLSSPLVVLPTRSLSLYVNHLHSHPFPLPIIASGSEGKEVCRERMEDNVRLNLLVSPVPYATFISFFTEERGVRETNRETRNELFTGYTPDLRTVGE